MEQSYYQTSGGSDAPILWYASLPPHVRRLYDYRGTFTQEPALMVVFAEVVCEAFTGWALGELFNKKGVKQLWEELSAGKKIRRFEDICNKNTRRIYTALSGDQITQANFWEKLQKHNKRRNDLVHPANTMSSSASIPSREEADESFKAVEDYIQHVVQVLGSIW